MRNRKAPESSSNGVTAFISLMIFMLAFLLNTYCPTAVVKTAVASAGLALPQATVQTFSQAARSAKSEPKAQETGNMEISDNTEITKKSQETAKKSDSAPQDILEMAKKYKADFSAASHDGKILEKTYGVANATSTFGNITVRNTTPSHSINIESSLSGELVFSPEDISKPTVLIFHTHTTESYEMLDEGWFTNSYSTRSNDPDRNMVRVGTAICEELEKSGIGYIHDTDIHDAQYTGAYDRSREKIDKILQENPTIQIVLDVHRDAIHNSETTRTKPVTTINGRKAAQIMIITGCEDGKVKSFPSWEKNLTFALKLQQKAETMYPSLMRPILFSARKYNMDVVPCSVLLEVGSDSNTLEEAEYSGHLIGRAISEFVKENK